MKSTLSRIARGCVAAGLVVLSGCASVGNVSIGPNADIDYRTTVTGSRIPLQSATNTVGVKAMDSKSVKEDHSWQVVN